MLADRRQLIGALPLHMLKEDRPIDAQTGPKLEPSGLVVSENVSRMFVQGHATIQKSNHKRLVASIRCNDFFSVLFLLVHLNACVGMPHRSALRMHAHERAQTQRPPPPRLFAVASSRLVVMSPAAKVPGINFPLL